ncbi:hypothetical protein FOMA001_g20273 [Fusarium oxysporum f. sp. matthiolae]|nr:hypothetical protein FOMA001_g20273 [Fusarium oxysporum f. sp. matthiolae]
MPGLRHLVFRSRHVYSLIGRANELFAPCTRPKLVYRCFHQEQLPPLQTASKEKSADAFSRWVESLDPLTLVVYSDGSLSSEGAASYGFTIHQNNIPIFDGSGRLGPAEVFDAEATGALEGLKAALNLRELATQNIFICLDNLAAATCLRGTPSESSQNVFLEFQALTTSHGAIQVRWVPGHSNIPGNEQADKLAKAASSLPEPEGAQPTLAYLRRIARQKPKEAFQAWWSTSAPEQYKRLNLKATTGCSPELSLPRAALHHLLAARSPPRGLRRVPREIQPRRCTPTLLMWPTQSTGSHLLLQKGTATSSDEADTLTERSSQSSSRKRLHQIHRPVQEQRVLWKDLPSSLGDDDQRSTCDSHSFSSHISFVDLFFLSLSFSYLFSTR